jgi:Zn-dependent protease with chaperone function
MPVCERRVIAGRTVLVVPCPHPLAFCAGLLRPRVYVSTGALQRLGAAELSAVVAHEAHYAARRDTLRILMARAIGDAYSLGALPRREQAPAELFADAAVVRSRGAVPLASALLAFDA